MCTPLQCIFGYLGDVDPFTELPRYTLLDPEETTIIRQRVREAVLRYFDYKENGKI